MSRSVPVMPNEVPGNYWTSALFNSAVEGLGNFVLAPPVFSGYQASSQSVTNATFTSLSIDTSLIDTDGGHSNTTNNSRYVAQVPGTYLVIGTTGWAANGTGYRRAQITLNGSGILGSAVNADANQVVASGEITMALVTMNGTSDYVEVQGSQNSGGTLGTSANSVFAPSLRIFFVTR